MTDLVKISELPTTDTVDASDIIPIVQGSTTKSIRRDHFLGPLEIEMAAMVARRSEGVFTISDAEDILRSQVFGG